MDKVFVLCFLYCDIKIYTQNDYESYPADLKFCVQIFEYRVMFLFIIIVLRTIAELHKI